MILAKGAGFKDFGRTDRGGNSAGRHGALKPSNDNAERNENSQSMPGYFILPNWGLLEAALGDCEGSLPNLHKKERIRWPFDVVCLGDAGDGQRIEECYLTYDDTIEVMTELYSLYSNSDLAIATGMSRARLSNYKRGSSRAPIELREFLEKVRRESLKNEGVL